MERSTRFLMLLKLKGKHAPTVAAAFAEGIQRLPEELRKTLTVDRGLEMAAHKSFTIATNVQVYFCDPRSPWQRGSNENINGLLRQYLPKGSDPTALHPGRSGRHRSAPQHPPAEDPQLPHPGRYARRSHRCNHPLNPP